MIFQNDFFKENKGLPKKWIWILISFFWLFISISTYFQDITARISKGLDNDHAFTILFSYGWLLWIPLTWFAIKISKSFPVNVEHPFKSIFIHSVFALLFSGLQVSLNATGIVLIAKAFFPEKNLGPHIPSYFIYTFHIHIIIYFLIMASYQGLQYLKHFQSQLIKNIHLESQLVSSQNLALKMQIQPHFLFNTHHSIISLMYQKRTDEAIAMLTSLSDLLRKTLDLPNKELVPLQDEIDMVKLYLSIQEIRFGDRLKVYYDISKESLSKKVPIFILQPLVENAIKHGIEPTSTASILKITAYVNCSKMHILVEDDGIGIAKHETKQGIGIKNIIARLENNFPKQYTFSIEPRLPKGTTIELQIPIAS